MVATVYLGDSNQEVTATNLTLGYMYARSPFTTTVGYVVTAVTLYQNAAPGSSCHLHFGLYGDSGGSPASQSLVSGSDSGQITLNNATGWQSYTYTTRFYLPPSTYWPTLLSDTSVVNELVRLSEVSTWYSYAQAYGALPATFSASPGSYTTGKKVSVYFTGIRVCAEFDGVSFENMGSVNLGSDISRLNIADIVYG